MGVWSSLSSRRIRTGLTLDVCACKNIIYCYLIHRYRIISFKFSTFSCLFSVLNHLWLRLEKLLSARNLRWKKIIKSVSGVVCVWPTTENKQFNWEREIQWSMCACVWVSWPPYAFVYVDAASASSSASLIDSTWDKMSIF